MPELNLAVEIADVSRNADRLADVEATAEQLQYAHPEAKVNHEDVVAALREVGGEPTWRADDAHFLPIIVRCGQSVEQITSLREAMRFLRHWPSDRQGPVFMCAERSCQAAAAGDMPLEQARQSFEGFASITGILAD
jgi:hypothetical protein